MPLKNCKFCRKIKKKMLKINTNFFDFDYGQNCKKYSFRPKYRIKRKK